MGHADYLKNGDYNAICDRCGSKFKFSQLRKEWDGLYVCTANGCWEPRQPQDYVRGIPDNMSVPISRPEAGNMFIQDEIVTEIPVISLTYSIFRLKLQTLLATVTSLATLTKIKYLYVSPKVINGSAINSTTIG